MFKYYIEKYVNNLKISDVYKFASDSNIKLTNDEANIIYNCIKNDYETIIYSNHFIVLDKIKNKLNINTYNKIIELINFYKNKYKNYL